jgi:hypothetical protein
MTRRKKLAPVSGSTTRPRKRPISMSRSSSVRAFSVCALRMVTFELAGAQYLALDGGPERSNFETRRYGSTE